LGKTFRVVDFDLNPFLEGLDEILHLLLHAAEVIDHVLRPYLSSGFFTVKNLEKRG
jgi:hypothetical protein